MEYYEKAKRVEKLQQMRNHIRIKVKNHPYENHTSRVESKLSNQYSRLSSNERLSNGSLAPFEGRKSDLRAMGATPSESPLDMRTSSTDGQPGAGGMEGGEVMSSFDLRRMID
mmetsp:Transcript_13254/g.20729  ORF Transcript_13254/g.20729 Transcript_13254/m.20729 type:complete len:113 (-) Transcript_13254:67-405(-)